jgi:hypothetical protein
MKSLSHSRLTPLSFAALSTTGPWIRGKNLSEELIIARWAKTIALALFISMSKMSLAELTNFNAVLKSCIVSYHLVIIRPNILKKYYNNLKYKKDNKKWKNM